jgi:hypothetical protein
MHFCSNLKSEGKIFLSLFKGLNTKRSTEFFQKSHDQLGDHFCVKDGFKNLPNSLLLRYGPGGLGGRARTDSTLTIYVSVISDF